MDHIATCMTFWYPGPIINHWLRCLPTGQTKLKSCSDVQSLYPHSRPHLPGTGSVLFRGLWNLVLQPLWSQHPSPSGSANLRFQSCIALLQSQSCSEDFLQEGDRPGAGLLSLELMGFQPKAKRSLLQTVSERGVNEMQIRPGTQGHKMMKDTDTLRGGQNINNSFQEGFWDPFSLT